MVVNKDTFQEGQCVAYAVEAAKYNQAPYVAVLLEEQEDGDSERLIHAWYSDKQYGIFDSYGEDSVHLIPHNWGFNSAWERDGMQVNLEYLPTHSVESYLEEWYANGLPVQDFEQARKYVRGEK